MGSLLDEDQEILGEMGWLPGDSSDDETAVTRNAPAESRLVERFLQPPRVRGAPWFEEMVENTGLGRFKKQRGGHTSRDGNVRVEWEVIEYTEGDDADDEGTTPGKRKIGEVEEGDADMRNA